jgi:hypothetical protein
MGVTRRLRIGRSIVIAGLGRPNSPVRLEEGSAVRFNGLEVSHLMEC